MLTGYLTFVSGRGKRRVYRGAGTGELVAERPDPMRVLDVGPADGGVVWLCGDEADGRTRIERLRLPDLAGEAIGWEGGRVGAVAAAPAGDRAVVLELPADVGDVPRLSVWSGEEWSAVEARPQPDISSKLAWLERDRIVFESDARRLTVLDLEAEAATSGPAGSSPSASWRRREWFAVSGEQVVSFGFDRPFESGPQPVEGFAHRSPSLVRFTSDGEVCVWAEPRALKRVKGYVQVRGGRRRRLRELDDGVAAVVGPLEEAA